MCPLQSQAALGQPERPRISAIGGNSENIYSLRILPQVCRFSSAGGDEADHRLEDPRLKSAEARNRGKWGTDGAPGSMGI
jgi:hypothetical protein